MIVREITDTSRKVTHGKYRADVLTGMGAPEVSEARLGSHWSRKSTLLLLYLLIAKTIVSAR